MNKSFAAIAALATVTPQLAEAVEYAFQPRIETGAMYYKYEQDAVAGLTTATGELLPGLTENTENTVEFTSQSGLGFADVLPFISGGGTVFIDRFYVDVSAQYAGEGADTDQTRRADFFAETPNDAFQQTEFNSWDADFDRIDVGISVGYTVTENFTAYAGYKYAKTDFDIKRNGTVRQDRCGDDTDPDGAPAGCVTGPVPFVSYNFTEDVELEFEQDGPFVGATFGTEFGSGTLTGNFAVAFLDATVKERSRNAVLTETGESLPPQKVDRDGDTIGLSAGISWWGSTPIDDLRYLLAVDGYRYSYDGEQNQDFSEELIRLKVGLAYTF